MDQCIKNKDWYLIKDSVKLGKPKLLIDEAVIEAKFINVNGSRLVISLLQTWLLIDSL